MSSAMLSNLTYFDYLVLVIIGLSAFFSMLRGMTREFLGLAGWVIAVFVAITSAPFLTEWLSGFLKVDGLTEILAWSIPFAAIVVIWFILASLISPWLKRAGLAALDKWFGIGFGILRGLLFVTVIYGGVVLYAGEETKLEDGILNSQSGPFISALLTNIQTSQFLPAIITDSLSTIELNARRPSLSESLNEAMRDGKDKADDALKLLKDERQ